MKIALDTNVLAYAEGINDPVRHHSAIRLIEGLQPQDCLIPVQVLGELFNVIIRRRQHTREYARQRIERWSNTFRKLDTTTDTLVIAIRLAAEHELAIWDAVVLATASIAGCRLLLSEDMQDGFTWGGVTVANPFADEPHPLLAAALAAR
ncbi:PIN domain-containing protein [Mesorhizobium sp. BAC0120]|uniref:PIN domain-containing protein n=1 Tax=Mesorhizobium sp. BAC0120 TaxID=3090670 RepID=UPI00298D25C7|nr:PIN domain-containing protein [Mesorhizobium sp. BAC0120]MDW6021772.1 PIN domain-containing protein [Mesorhizobium sp. BAC0120]